MANIFGIWGDEDKDNNNNKTENRTENAENEKLSLRQEQLDINKNKVQAGEVILSKDVVEEQKTVDVPVTHEEVVIERRSINNEATDSPIGSTESIHIPVSEEKVEVGKHTVVTGEVSAHKREVEETKKVEETLKREEARIDTEGNPNIVSNSENNMQ
ncbi:YsnF/AvaK domain-containing protein [Clostridium aciditolerans]|uniref:YsnF/AvaK domain-containing protein n=1 Tax=Clostridium aciditolerans TaxID=339861 RepID=A0A934M2F8_9CLOT|nr:YsnF/AvaK domain-containing protein [Clostridium aciditolerans]MBI6872097.1 YsnF/AvaK domain-containing protein [Clostridium aciditolerans]